MVDLKGKIRYFAAANSCRGFVSLFEDIFGDLPRLFIIKGGSGTGKSRMMGDIASAAEKRGYAVERYYCSADATSLDGIIIRDVGIGMIDGTAPHTRDPKYPGAVDEIVNVGAFWDTASLTAHVDEIRGIVDAKSEEFACAFDALAAAGMAERTVARLRSGAIEREKIAKSAGRLSAKWRRGEGFTDSVRVLDAFTMRGPATLNTFSETAEKLYIVAGKRGAAPSFLSEIVRAAKAKDQPVIRALDPLTMSDTVEVCLPELGAAFVRDAGERTAERVINTDLFVNAAKLRENKYEIGLFTRRKRELIDTAQVMLGKAAERHFRLEEIYSSAMDFAAKEELTRTLIDRIFEL